MTDFSFDDLRIVPLPLEFDPGGFRCGNSDYDDYLTDGTALRDEAAGVTRTYLVYYDDKIVAYYSVLNDSINLEFREKKKVNITYSSVPALKLGRLAVDESMKGKHTGQYLVKLVVGLGLELSRAVGCRYITLDALPEREQWYASMGFVRNKQVVKDQRLAGSTADPPTISMRYDLKTADK